MSGEYPFISYEELENAFYEMTPDQQIGLMFSATLQWIQYLESRVPGNDLGFYVEPGTGLTQEQLKKNNGKIGGILFMALAAIGEAPQFLSDEDFQQAVQAYQEWDMNQGREKTGKVFIQDAADLLVALSKQSSHTAIEL